MIAVRVETRMLADHRRQLESVELGHRDVDEDDRDLVAQTIARAPGVPRSP